MSYIKIGPDTYSSNDPKNTADRLPGGVYHSGSTGQGMPVLVRRDVQKDQLILLPGMAASSILAEIRKFWKSRDRYHEMGVVHKRGIILAGPQGCGKTSLVAMLVDQFVTEFDGIVLSIADVDFVGSGLRIVRGVESDRPVMVLIEDFEDALRRGNESQFLNVVDGRDQTSGVVFVATTNHLDQLPPRITNRPSRFDLVVNIGWPSADARRAYLRARSRLDADKIEQIVRGSEQWGIAHLKEIVLLVEVYECDVAAAIERMAHLVGRKMSPEDLERKARLQTVSVFSTGLSGDVLGEAYRRAEQRIQDELENQLDCGEEEGENDDEP